MSKHTPGQWSVETQFRVLTNVQKNTETRIPYFEIGSDLRRLATVDSGMNDEANARLIAAAPEMLQALKTIHVFYTDYTKHTLVPVSELRTLLEKTIAKAEGKTK